jgi:hypothetical protein
MKTATFTDGDLVTVKTRKAVFYEREFTVFGGAPRDRFERPAVAP